MQLFGQKLDNAWLAAVLMLVCGPDWTTAAPVMFGRFTLDRPLVHAGEAFQLTLAIHISGETLDKQINIANLPPPTDMQLLAFQELPIETAPIEGRAYEIRKFRTWARGPRAGTLTLAPQLNGTLVQTTRSFFMLQESRRPVSIPVEPFPLAVQPVPSPGQPADFSGLVGMVDFSARAAPLDIAAGDLITLTFTIRGDWLPDTFPAPRIKPSQGLKVYDPRPVPEESSPGKRVYRQTVVPENSSVTELPACALSYFDTRTATYRTLTQGPFRVQFHPERALPQPVYAPSPRGTDPRPHPPVASPTPHAQNTWWPWISRFFSDQREMPLTGQADVIVRLAPSESSQALFNLKPGMVVTEEAVQDNWIRISCPKGIGWIPKTSTE